jgi:hypothetical protein
MTNTAGAAMSGDRGGGVRLSTSSEIVCRAASCCSTLAAVSRASLIASFAFVVVCLAAPPVSAQQQRTDPDASSPAGVIYEIPFDTARKDAAPKKARATADDGSGDQQNNGTSSAGAAGTSGSGGGGNGDSGASGATASTGSSGSSSENPNVGTSIHSENGFGSSSRVPGVAGATVGTDGPPSSALHSDSSSSTTSPAVTYGLLLILLVVGGWIGLAASRGLRTST